MRIMNFSISLGRNCRYAGEREGRKRPQFRIHLQESETFASSPFSPFSTRTQQNIKSFPDLPDFPPTHRLCFDRRSERDCRIANVERDLFYISHNLKCETHMDEETQPEDFNSTTRAHFHHSRLLFVCNVCTYIFVSGKTFARPGVLCILGILQHHQPTDKRTPT